MTEAYTSFENNLRYYGRVENGEIVEYGSQVLSQVYYLDMFNCQSIIIIFSFRFRSISI